MKKNELTKWNNVTDPENLSQEYQMESLSKAEEEIRDLHEKLAVTAKMSLALAFELGKRLTAVKENLDHGEFLPWLEQNCDFSQRTARHYMQVFNHFKSATVADLAEKTVQQAYIEAGITKAATVSAAAQQPEKESRYTGEIKTAGTVKSGGEKMGEMIINAFKDPTKSGIELKHHRVETVGEQIWTLRNLPFNATPAMTLHLLFRNWPQQAKEEVLKAFEVALEMYCAKVEELEERKLIEPPLDMDFKKNWYEANGKKTRRRA